jgi:hypothetical protein
MEGRWASVDAMGKGRGGEQGLRPGWIFPRPSQAGRTAGQQAGHAGQQAGRGRAGQQGARDRVSSVTRPAAAHVSSAASRSAAVSAPAAQALSRAATGESRSARASGRASDWKSAGRLCRSHFWWYASACRTATSAHDGEEIGMFAQMWWAWHGAGKGERLKGKAPHRSR